MKNLIFANSDFAPTRRQVLGLGMVLAGAAAINVVPGFQLLASAQAAARSTRSQQASLINSR